MLQFAQNAQVLVLAVALVTAGLAKLLVGEPGAAAPRAAGHFAISDPPLEAAPAWLRLSRGRRAAVLVGAYECALGGALLVTSHGSARMAAAATFAVMTVVVIELRARHPGAGCGCLGGLSGHPVDRRGILRAALLTAAALLALGAPLSGLAALSGPAGPAGPGGPAGLYGAAAALAMVAELAVLAAISPEIGELVARRRTPVPCERRSSPIAETYETLHASDAWLEHENVLATAVPLDLWRERCWRFLVYPARVAGQEVEIVFAVSTEERHRVVRSALVEANHRPATERDADDTGENPAYALTGS